MNSAAYTYRVLKEIVQQPGVQTGGLPPLAPGALPGLAPRLTAEAGATQEVAECPWVDHALPYSLLREVLSKLDRESRRSGTASARLVAAMGSLTLRKGRPTMDDSRLDLRRSFAAATTAPTAAIATAAPTTAAATAAARSFSAAAAAYTAADGSSRLPAATVYGPDVLQVWVLR